MERVKRLLSHSPSLIIQEPIIAWNHNRESDKTAKGHCSNDSVITEFVRYDLGLDSSPHEKKRCTVCVPSLAIIKTDT